VGDPWAVPPGLREAEQRAWFELQAWQREFVGRARGARAGDPGERVDGAVIASAAFGPGPPADEPELPGPTAARLQRSLLAVTTAITDQGGGASVRARHQRVLGVEPTPAAVAALDLRVVDRIASRGSTGRTLVSAGVGGVTGSIAAGAGVAGAATGGLALGAAVGVMALTALADASFVVLQASRTTARTAAVYGFDPGDPDEQAAVLAVVGAALAPRRDRAAALGRSHHVARLITDRLVHGAAPTDAARLLIRQLHHGLVLSLSGQQLRRGVPVLGAALGSVTTARTSRHVDEVARQLYRDRFLRRRSAFEQLAAGQRGQIGAGAAQPGTFAGS
jgi:hypothetical protein